MYFVYYFAITSRLDLVPQTGVDELEDFVWYAVYT